MRAGSALQEHPAYTPPVTISHALPMAYAFKSPHRAAAPRARAAAALALAVLASPLTALAAPQLQCSFDVNSETHHKTFGLVTDPYTTEAVAIGNRFRFKAVMLAGEAGTGVQSLNLYVYYNTRRQPMIMQHTRFLQPAVLPAPAPDALTGRVSLYSPLLGKELQYQCALAEVAP